MPKTLLLIDGPAHLYRAFYAIRPLTDPQGRPVNAVYGFAHMLLNLLEQFKPDYGIAVFDTPAPTERHTAYPEYKSHREKMPEDLQVQIPLVKDLLSAFGFTLAEQPGYEADDLIGTLAGQARKAGVRVLIFSTDKDLLQLVDPQVSIVRPVRGGKGETEVLDSDGVERFFGVPPGKVVDVLALMGDASDNIPGVPGVGEKTALEFIRRFGSVEELYRSLDKLDKPRWKEKLAAAQAQAELSKRLATINLAVPLAWTWETSRLPDSLPEAAARRLAEYGFKSLLRSMPQAPAAIAAWTQGLDSCVELGAVAAEARRTGQLAVEILPQGAAFAASAHSAAWVPLTPDEFRAALDAGAAWVDLLTDASITKVGYDLKPLAVALLRAGRKLGGPLEDLHLAAHLLDLPSNRIQDFISRILGGPPPEDQPALLACADLMALPSVPPRLQAVGAEAVYRDLELPLLPVLAGMEAHGVAVDLDVLQTMSLRLGLQLQNLEKSIQQQAGVEFNIRSTQQLAEVLFDRLKLMPGKKTKTGRSTSVEILESLAAEHPVPALVLEYRQLQKLKSTYLDALPALVDPKDRRLHTTFHQVGAATGRLSSSDPNLQNIPIRSELGRELREAFVPGRAGDALLSADYSQIELRLLAHLSGDEQMLFDFSAGLDIHRATASELFHVSPDAVTPEMRRQAKVCNFGIAYGVSPYGLARQLGISPGRGREFIDRFFMRYPGVRQYLDRIIADARAQGYISTLLGRRRPVPDIASANRNIREAAERMAINTPIQGSAADLIKLAMINIDRELAGRSLQSRMILQVHDELVFEGPDHEMPALKDLVVAAMSKVIPLKVELVVEAAWGKNWMAAHG